MTTYLTMLIPGGQEAVERALQDCEQQNGGKLVGNPSAPSVLIGQPYQGHVVSAIFVEAEADPRGWWADYKRVHGWQDGPSPGRGD